MNAKNRKDHEIARHRFNFVGQETYSPNPFVAPLTALQPQTPVQSDQSQLASPLQMSTGSAGSVVSPMDISPAPVLLITPDVTPRSRSLSAAHSTRSNSRPARRTCSVRPSDTHGFSSSMPPPLPAPACSRSCSLHCSLYSPAVNLLPPSPGSSNPVPSHSAASSPTHPPPGSSNSPASGASRGGIPASSVSPSVPPPPPPGPSNSGSPGPSNRKCRYCLHEFASSYHLNRHIQEDRCVYVFAPSRHNMRDYCVLRRPGNYQVIKRILEQLSHSDQVIMCRENQWAMPGIWPIVFPGPGSRQPPILSEMTAARESTSILRALLRVESTVHLPKQIILLDEANDIKSVLVTRLLTPGTAFASQLIGDEINVSLRKYL